MHRLHPSSTEYTFKVIMLILPLLLVAATALTRRRSAKSTKSMTALMRKKGIWGRGVKSTRTKKMPLKLKRGHGSRKTHNKKTMIMPGIGITGEQMAAIRNASIAVKQARMKMLYERMLPDIEKELLAAIPEDLLK